jgi:hypothetical protein
VRSGGVVISLGSSATSFLTDEKTDLLDSALENLAFSSDKKKEEKKEDGRVAGRLIASQKEYLDAIKPDAAWPDAVPGALLRARLDPDHWLAAGTDTMVYALLNGANIFTPLTLDKGYNAAVYTDASNAVASGYIWEENRRQAAFKPLLMEQQQGRGLVIGFTSDPNFRGYMDGLNILLLNAVFRGPAHANPQVTE